MTRVPKLRNEATSLFALVALAIGAPAFAAEPEGAARFQKDIAPLITEFCIDCHGNGLKSGGVSLDEFESDRTLLSSRELWWKALKQLRSGMMPPADHPQPVAEQKQRIMNWIKDAVFEIDRADPDPGRVTVRRLNRTEYRNTIRDLLGVDYDTQTEFPPDDTGHGFDTIADVLTISPLLLEKYLAAAKAVVSAAVPTASGVVAEKTVPGKQFRKAGAEGDPPTEDGLPLPLSYYEAATYSVTTNIEHPGRYRLVLDMTCGERYVDNVFDYNRCRFTFEADGQPLVEREFAREGSKPFRFEFDREWQAGLHEVTLKIEPLTPDEKQVRQLQLRIKTVAVVGPFDEKHFVRPKNYERYFGNEVPADAAARHAHVRALLTSFATRAFRRPVDAPTVERLVGLAEHVAARPRSTFEAGIAQAMVAVLASPRFLFREEDVEAAGPGRRHPYVDEYALASRLSYFLWSTMPDEELFRLAGEHKLRENLPAQVKRLLGDSRSEALTRNFVGQWLQVRDIDSVPINAAAVMSREAPAAEQADMERRRARFRELRNKPPETLTEAEKQELEAARPAVFGRRFSQFELNTELRTAMRREVELLFEHIIREDRTLLELIDCDYTFVNERLARHYGFADVTGPEMRRIALSPDSPRGGILTTGTMLAVTSNPDRTSPVKRGVFILDNILGTPPAPPPPNIPSLEESGKDIEGRKPTLRETLALHRSDRQCSACHERMDPLGLALENFNALGIWREKEQSQPIDVAGKLITGESFANVREMKRVLVTDRRGDFYRCLTEKLLTYALGRGLDYHDVQTVDTIAERLEQENGRPSVLLMSIIESAPFQKSRNPDAAEPRSSDAASR